MYKLVWDDIAFGEWKFVKVVFGTLTPQQHCRVLVPQYGNVFTQPNIILTYKIVVVLHKDDDELSVDCGITYNAMCWQMVQYTYIIYI